MPRDLLALAAVQMLHWSGQGRSWGKPESWGTCRAKDFGITVLLLLFLCSSPVLADTFGLGTAGPSNWGVLETGTGTVSFSGGSSSSPSGISVNAGASASQANLGINSGGKLNSASTTVINGTYYMWPGNNDATSGTAFVGGVVTGTAAQSVISAAVSSAQSATVTLGALTATLTAPNLNNPGSSVTITGVAGRNVVNVPIINLGNGISLTLNGPATASFVINITGAGTNGGITLNSSQLLVSGGLSSANVIYNVTGSGANVSASGNGDLVDGILMDLNGMESINAVSVNGEVISSGNISLSNGGDVQVVETVPEASTTAYFTLGPLSLIAVMLLHRRFSRRKQTVVRDGFG
jgi:hypothetical protein